MSEWSKRDARWVKSCLGLHEGDACDESVRIHARKQMDDEGGGERDAREGREWREVRVMGCRSQMRTSTNP